MLSNFDMKGKVKNRMVNSFYLILLAVFGCIYTTNGATTYTWTGGTSIAWATTTNWSPNGNPGSATGDAVIFAAAGSFQPTLTVAPTNTLTSITFNNTGITLTITTVTLTVSGAVTLNSSATANLTNTITGTGTLSCGSFQLGTTVVPTGARTTGVTLTLTNLISTNQFTINSSFSSFANNCTVTHTSGTVSCAGLTTVSPTSSTSAYVMGNTSPTLKLNSATPVTVGSGGTSTFTFTGTGATVQYLSSSNISMLSSPAGLMSYKNLLIGGGSPSTKTFAGNLTLSGTLTVNEATTMAMGTFTISTPTTLTLFCGSNVAGAAITGSGVLTLGGGVTITDATTGTLAATISNPVSLGAATRVFTVNDDGTTAEDLVLSGNISATAGLLSKSGTGTLTLSGANSHSSGTTLTTGEIHINSTTAIGTGAFIINGGSIDNTSGSSITLSTNNAITLGASFTYNGTNDINFGTGAITNSGSRTITLSGTSRTLTMGGTMTNTLGAIQTTTVNGTGNTLVIGAYALSNSATSFVDVISGSGNVIISGAVTNGGTATTSGLTLNSTGVLTLSGTNTYAGNTTLTAGTLKLNSTTALGAAASNFIINGGTIDNITGSSLTLANNNPITLGGNFAFTGTNDLNLGTGAVTNSGSRTISLNGTNSTLTLGGTMTNTLGAIQTTTVNGSGNTLVVAAYNLSNNASNLIDVINGTGNVTISGVVADGGTSTASGLTYSGSGTLTLNGANTFSGGATISSGTVAVNTLANAASSSSLGDGNTTPTITIGATGTLKYTGSGHSSSRAIAISSGATIDGSGGGTLTLSGAVSGSGNGLVLTGTGTNVYSGAIGTGIGTLTKNGGGTWTLSNNTNSYTGLTTVTNGTLLWGASNVVSSGGLTVSGGTVDLATFTESCGAVSLTGGTITSSTGTLTGTSFDLQSGTISGILAGAVQLVKTTSGTVTISSANTCTAGASISAGTLNINNASALGTNVGTFTITGGTIDASSGVITTVNYPLAINGSFAFTGTNALNLGTGTVTMNGDYTITTTASTLTIGGTLNQNTRTLNKAGGGTLAFGSNAVTLNGLTISAGTLTSTSNTLSLAGDFTNNSTFSHNGGTVNFNGTTQAIGGSSSTTFSALTCSNSGTKTMGANITTSGTLTFSGTADLSIASNTLTINGDLIGSSSSCTLIGSKSSNLTIGGSGTITSNFFFDQSTASDSGLNNLIINRSGGTMTLGSKLKVFGDITPTAGTIASGGLLVVASDASGTGNILSGSGSVTGTVIVQRFIPSVGRRFRFLASNVASATLGDWKNETHITGIGGATNNFDASASNKPSVYGYTESVAGVIDNGWVEGTNGSTDPITTGKGYRLFIRGQRAAIKLTDDTQPQEAVTLDLQGTVNSGNIVMPVSYTTTAGGTSADGWCLLGNPYPCAIDWNAFHDAGRTGSSPDYSGTDYAHLDAFAYIYDPLSNNYVNFNATSTGTGSFTNGIIPSGSAFFVKAATATGLAMTMKEVYKSTSNTESIFKTNSGPNYFRIKMVKDSINSDEIVLAYKDDAKDSLDGYDTYKFYGPEVNLASMTNDGAFLSVNFKTYNGKSDSIKLSMGIANTGDYRFEFSNVPDLLGSTDNTAITLVDKFLNKTINVRTNANYAFSADKNNAGSWGNDRFMIVIGEFLGLQKIEPTLVGKIGLYPTPTLGQTTIYSSTYIHGEANIVVYDVMGKVVMKLNKTKWTDNKIDLNLGGLQIGAYFIQVNSDQLIQPITLKCIKQ